MLKRITAQLVLANTPTVKAAYGAVNNRGPGFDTIRLIAASAVVLHHSLKVEIDIVRDDWLFQLSHGYTQTGLLAVSVFFALSGFLVTPGLAKTGDVVAFVSRRFMRIMPLLTFIVVATALVIGPIFSSVPPGEYYTSAQTWWYLKSISTSLSLQLPGVIDYDGGDTINGPMWTLRYEWLCYFAIAGSSLIGFFRYRLLFLASWASAITLLLVLYGPIPADGARDNLFTLFYLFSYFGAGVLIFLYNDVLRWSPTLMIAALIALIAAFAAGFGFVLAPFLVAYLVVGLGLIEFPWQGLLARADLSYGVYLTHSVILMMLMSIHPFSNGLLLFAIAWPLSCLAALGTWTFIERPALQHKDWPASLARPVIDRVPLARSLLRARPREI